MKYQDTLLTVDDWKNTVPCERSTHKRPYTVWLHLYETSGMGMSKDVEGRVMFG